MSAAAQMYAEGLAGGPALVLRYSDGRTRPLPLHHYLAQVRPGDAGLLARCRGAVLDVGCGPGRLAVALGGRGTTVLGVDIAPGAADVARGRGALVLVRSVFDRLPGAGRWGTALLADGNVGIGGDPVVLLRRLHDLLAPAGLVLVELDPPGERSGPVRVRLESGDRSSAWFAWAHVACDRLAPLAARADFRVDDTWQADGRWFAALRACAT